MAGRGRRSFARRPTGAAIAGTIVAIPAAAAFDWCIAEVGHNPLNYNFSAGGTARPASVALAAPPQAAIDTQSGPQHLPRPLGRSGPAPCATWPFVQRKHARPPSASSPTFASAATRAPDRRKKSPHPARSLKIPRDADRRTVKTIAD